MSTPPTLKQLCDEATKGPWKVVAHKHLTPTVRCSKGAIALMDTAGAMIGPEEMQSNAQLIARLDPQTMMRVYEALDCIKENFIIFKKGSSFIETKLTQEEADLVITALRLLDGIDTNAPF